MTRGAVMLACALLAGAVSPAMATPSRCPIPDSLGLGDISLPATRQAVAAGRLVVLTVGGSASSGLAAGGVGATYPAQLELMLREQLHGTNVLVVPRAQAHMGSDAVAQALDTELAATGARLVIWGVGPAEAGSGIAPDALEDTIQNGIAKIQKAGADVILMDLQYAPSVARVLDLVPYRDATLRAAAANEVPVLDRYELMREWSNDGVLDLDATDPKARIQVARELFACLATVLADGIVKAAR